MPFETALLFLLTDLAFTSIPGPAMMIVLAHALPPAPAGGLRGAIGPIMGINLGNCVWYALTAAGLVVLIAQFPLGYALLRWGGVGFLLLMGARMLWRARANAPQQRASVTARFWRGFATGFAGHLANPKALLFYTMVVPPFVDPKHPLLPQFLALAGLTFISETSIQSVMAILTGRARSLATSERAAARLPFFSGLVLIAVALVLAAFNLSSAFNAAQAGGS